jgi:hypothetical protein
VTVCDCRDFLLADLLGVSRVKRCPGHGVSEAWHAEVGGAVAVGDLAHGLESLFGCLEGELHPSDLAESAFAAGLGDARLEVVAISAAWAAGPIGARLTRTQKPPSATGIVLGVMSIPLSWPTFASAWPWL